MSKPFSFQQLFQSQMPIPTQLLTNYKQLGLLEIDVMIILHMHHFLQNGNDFPTPQEICERMTISENQLLHHLRTLIQKNIIEMKELRNEQNQLSEAYSLDPLWEKLFLVKEEPAVENHEGTIFILFEQEF